MEKNGNSENLKIRVSEDGVVWTEIESGVLVSITKTSNKNIETDSYGLRVNFEELVGCLAGLALHIVDSLRYHPGALLAVHAGMLGGIVNEAVRRKLGEGIN